MILNVVLVPVAARSKSPNCGRIGKLQGQAGAGRDVINIKIEYSAESTAARINTNTTPAVVKLDDVVNRLGAIRPKLNCRSRGGAGRASRFAWA